MSYGRPSLGGRNLGLPKLPQSKDVYCFPILDTKEIIEILRTEMGVVVTEDDFNKPKAEQFRQICEVFVIDILGTSKEEMNTPNEEFLSCLGEHADLHDESVPVIHFLRNINKVLQAARCDEGLNLRDLMKPDKARMVRVICGLINLQKFRKDKLVWYDSLESETQDVIARTAAVRAKKEEVRARIAQEQALRAAEQPAINAVLAQKKELEEQLTVLRNQDEAARASTGVQRQEILAMREVKKELQKQLEASKEEAELRKAQIVSSPARLKAEIVSLEGLVNQEQRAVDELDEQKRILSRQLEVVAKAEKDINKAMLLMGEAEAEAKKLKAVLKDEKLRKGEAESINADTDAQQAQLDHALAQKRRAEEKLKDVKEALGQRLTAQMRAIDVTRRETNEYADELKAAIDSRRAAEAEKMKLERHQASLMAKHSQEVAEMISTMRHFSATVNQYDNGLVSVLSGIDAIDVSPVRS